MSVEFNFYANVKLSAEVRAAMQSAIDDATVQTVLAVDGQVYLTPLVLSLKNNTISFSMFEESKFFDAVSLGEVQEIFDQVQRTDENEVEYDEVLESLDVLRLAIRNFGNVEVNHFF